MRGQSNARLVSVKLFSALGSAMRASAAVHRLLSANTGCPFAVGPIGNFGLPVKVAQAGSPS